MQELCFRVPRAYTLPPFYNHASPAEIAAALTFGAEAHESLQRKVTDTVRKETHADAVQRALEEHRTTVAELEAAHERAVAKLRAEAAAAKLRVEALEQAASSLRAQVQREARETMVDVVKGKDEQIQRLEAMLEKQMAAVVGKVEGLQNSFTKTFSSSKEKGALGELIVEQFLKKAFDCDVQLVSKDAQTADMRMVRGPQAEYFWEIKNYTRMVTTEEIEKFRRDMRLHPGILAGCLVSMRTGIVGKSRGGDIDVEFLEDGRCIVFIGNLMAREDVVFYLQTLRPLFQTLETFAKPAKEESETVRVLQAKATLVANLLRSHSVSVAKHRNALLQHKKRSEAMFTEFQGYVLESETQLQTLLRITMGDENDSDAAVREVDTVLPAFVFSKGRLADLEGRTKEFVAWLLGATEAREGTQLEIKDLLERAKGQGFGEKFVRETREELFQPAAWARGSRFVLGLRWVA